MVDNDSLRPAPSHPEGVLESGLLLVDRDDHYSWHRERPVDLLVGAAVFPRPPLPDVTGKTRRAHRATPEQRPQGADCRTRRDGHRRARIADASV
jgi:hypothetical protein